MDRMKTAFSRWSKLGTVVAFGSCWLSAPGTWAGVPERYEHADLKVLQESFAKLADDVRPSVVAIVAYQAPSEQPSERTRVMRPINQGSGFVLDAVGAIATNRHVITGADVLFVTTHTGERFEATLVQEDMRSDLAVLRVDARDLAPVRLGSLSQVRVNHWTFAVGNPFGLANSGGQSSVTFGAVSALGRQLTDRLARDSEREYYGNLIETTSTINPGMSGGPLFNVDGEVIGVVTAIETSSGVSEGHGFAIPMDDNTRRILELLSKAQPVRYGFLGVEVSNVTKPSARYVAALRGGAEIQRISIEAGPAAAAGLQPEDIVIEFGGVLVEDSDHLVRLVGFTPVGATTQLTYVRDGVKRKTSVTIGDRETLLNARTTSAN